MDVLYDDVIDFSKFQIYLCRFEISDETITTLETFANIEGQEKGR